MRTVLMGLMALMLAGCGGGKVTATAEEQAFAGEVLTAVRNGDFAQVQSRMRPEVRALLTQAKFAEFTAAMPSGAPELRTVQHHEQELGGAAMTFKMLNYQVGGEGRWAAAQVAVHDDAGRLSVAGLQVAPMSGPAPAEKKAD